MQKDRYGARASRGRAFPGCLLWGSMPSETKLPQNARQETDRSLFVEREKTDAEIEKRSVAARDNFMTMVGHDVRNPLGGIALGTAVQIQNPSRDEAGQRNLKTSEKIQRLTARINRLIGDLFDVTGIESGQFLAHAPATRAVEAQKLRSTRPTPKARAQGPLPHPLFPDCRGRYLEAPHRDRGAE